MATLNSRVSIYSGLYSYVPETKQRNCIRCGQDFDCYVYRGADAKVCKPCRPPGPIRAVYSRSVLFGKPLSNRELQIVELNSEGHANKEIAARLHLTEGTIKVFMGRIFMKTGMDNRLKLARWWWEKSDKPSKPA